MLGKLMKHEIKGTYRNFLVVYIGVFLFSILAGLSTKMESEFIIAFLVLALYGFVFGAIFMIISQCIKMFTRDLYSQRGYLALTLPVKTWELLLSKILVMIIWVLLTYAVGIVSFLCFCAPLLMGEGISIIELLDAVIRQLNLPLSFYILIIVGSIVSVFSTISLIGVSTSLVRLGKVHKWKGFLSVVIFFVVSYLMQYVSGLLLEWMDLAQNINISLYDLEHNGLAQLVPLFQNTMLFQIGFNMLFGSLYFALTSYLLGHKIEIE